MAELKRLAFVEKAAVDSFQYVTATSAFSKACGYYTAAKETSALKGSLTKLEDLIKAYGEPVASKVAESYPTVATNVDAKVDKAVVLALKIWEDHLAASLPITYTTSAYKSVTDPATMDKIITMREEYFKKIEEALESFKSKAVSLPAELKIGLTAAIEQARANLDSTILFNKVKVIWETVLSQPQVAMVMEKSAPAIEKAVETVKAVQASPYYVKAVDTVGPYVTSAVTTVSPYVTTIKERFAPAASA